MKNILIIGGGISGTTAAEEIRARDKECSIIILEAEVHPCYSRVLLPHYVKGKVGREKVFLKQPQWYYDHKIEIMLGVRAEEIDLKNKFVRTSEQRELPFDQLLVTTGTEIDLLHDDRRGVSYLSTIDDADALVALIGELKTRPVEEQKAFIYGGGFIALEYANMFAHHGIPFGIAMRGPGFWSRLLSKESQQVLADHAKKNNIPLYFDEPNIELLGDEELMGVKLKSGETIPCGILGIGIGARANEKVVMDAGIPTNNGILANEYLETSVEHVYTAGDAAEFDDQTVGRRIRYGNWMNALMQGRAVGKTMAGERTKFSMASSYSTNFLGLQIVFIGDTSREHADEILVVPPPFKGGGQEGVSGPAAEEHFIRGGKLVGAVLIGDVAHRAALTKNIGSAYVA